MNLDIYRMIYLIHGIHINVVVVKKTHSVALQNNLITMIIMIIMMMMNYLLFNRKSLKTSRKSRFSIHQKHFRKLSKVIVRVWRVFCSHNVWNLKRLMLQKIEHSWRECGHNRIIIRNYRNYILMMNLLLIGNNLKCIFICCFFLKKKCKFEKILF